MQDKDHDVRKYLECRNKNQFLWNDYYSSQTPEDDNWLAEYSSLFQKVQDPVILDLGCGNGANLPLLTSFSRNVSAFDFSEVAVRAIEQRFEVRATVGDMRHPLPYADYSFDFVISDLSLQYFNAAETRSIVDEICRVLRPKGLMFARVNSINDTLHGARQGEEIEPGLYLHDGILKRFFDEGMIHNFFSFRFEILELQQRTSGKYLKLKQLWQMVLMKRE